jgi:hypothetical protein
VPPGHRPSPSRERGHPDAPAFPLDEGALARTRRMPLAVTAHEEPPRRHPRRRTIHLRGDSPSAGTPNRPPSGSGDGHLTFLISLDCSAAVGTDPVLLGDVTATVGAHESGLGRGRCTVEGITRCRSHRRHVWDYGFQVVQTTRRSARSAAKGFPPVRCYTASSEVQRSESGVPSYPRKCALMLIPISLEIFFFVITPSL